MRYNNRYSASAADISSSQRKPLNGSLLSNVNNSGPPPSGRPMSLALSLNKTASQRQPKTRAPRANDSAPLDANDLSRRLQVVLAQQQRREAAEVRSAEKKKRWSTLSGKGIPTMSSKKDAPPPVPPLPAQTVVALPAQEQPGQQPNPSPPLRRPASAKLLRRKSKIFTEPVAMVAKRLSVATTKSATKVTSHDERRYNEIGDDALGARPPSGIYVPQQAARQFAETTTATGMRRSIAVQHQRKRTTNMSDAGSESYLAVVAALTDAAPDADGTPEAALRQLEGDDTTTPAQNGKDDGATEHELLQLLQRQREQMQHLDAKLQPHLSADLPKKRESKCESKHESKHESKRESHKSERRHSLRSDKSKKRDDKKATKDLPPVPTIDGAFVAQHAFEDSVSYRRNNSKQPKTNPAAAFNADPFDFGHETIADSFDLINNLNQDGSNLPPNRASYVSGQDLAGRMNSHGAAAEVDDESLAPVDPATLRDRRADWTQRDEMPPQLKHQRTFEKLRSKSMWGLRSRFRQSRDENTYEVPQEKHASSPRSLPISFGSNFHRSSQQPKTLKTTKSKFFGLFKH